MTQSPCRFEDMRDEFLPEIQVIYNHYIRNSTATFHAKELTLDEMGSIVYTGDPRFKSSAIFDENDILCGYCILAQFKKREAYNSTAEVTVYLKPDHTGRGLGRLAVAHLEKTAREYGFHVLLAIICGENTESINLFSKCGYEKCAHYREVGTKFGRLLDVVSYQKIL